MGQACFFCMEKEGQIGYNEIMEKKGVLEKVAVMLWLIFQADPLPIISWEPAVGRMPSKVEDEALCI